jgi:hypothetical protein
MSRYWFRPHRYGYGATPTDWKGWVAVAGFVVLLVTLTLPLLAWPAELPDGAAAWQIATWSAMVALLTFGFIRFCRDRTDGQWRWRWGK